MSDQPEQDPDCLEGPGRTREQMIADWKELDRVAPTPAVKFALMFGSPRPKYMNRGGEIWERTAGGERELFAADVVKRLLDFEDKHQSVVRLAGLLLALIRVNHTTGAFAKCSREELERTLHHYDTELNRCRAGLTTDTPTNTVEP